MQFSAAAASRSLVLLMVTAVAAGCGALGGSSAEPSLQSEALAFHAEPGTGADPATGADGTAVEGATRAEPADTDPVDTTGADGATGANGRGGTDGASPTRPAEAVPAPGSSDPDPALSPDPDIHYPAGTCHATPFPGAPAAPVGCDEPHDIEVYASADLPGGPGAPYQGLAAAIELCGAEFRPLTGVGLNLATVFGRSVLRPSEETWADGERTVTCYVVYPELTTKRLDSIDPVRSFGRVSVFGLAAGDCLTTFDQDASWFEVIPCEQPHEAEVFVADVQPESGFPGEAELDARSDELCFGQPFETFVGRDYASSSVFSIVSVPTAETWAQGDRTINCILTDDLVRSSSFQASGL